jgi:hypothetical protein
MFFNAAKAVQELGLPQTSVEEALVEAINWYSDEGYFNVKARPVITGANQSQNSDVAQAG